MLLLFVTVVTVVQWSAKAENAQKNPGKTRKYLGFPGYFRVSHWTLEIVVGHCQAFLIVVLSRPNVSYCCWGAPLLFCS